MSLRLLAVALLLSAQWLRADTLLTQEVETVGGRGEMTVRFHDGKIRTDLAEPVSTLFDPATGETLCLQHHPKTFTRLTRAQSEELARKLQQATPPGQTGRLESTGQKQEIAGHPTELFLWTVGGLRFRFWVARDFSNADALNALLDQLQSSGPAQGAAALLPTRAALPGVRLRTEMDAEGQHITYTILSVAEAPADDALFQVPPGYKEVPFAISPLPKAP